MRYIYTVRNAAIVQQYKKHVRCRMIYCLFNGKEDRLIGGLFSRLFSQKVECFRVSLVEDIQKIIVKYLR